MKAEVGFHPCGHIHPFLGLQKQCGEWEAVQTWANPSSPSVRRSRNSPSFPHPNVGVRCSWDYTWTPQKFVTLVLCNYKASSLLLCYTLLISDLPIFQSLKYFKSCIFPDVNEPSCFFPSSPMDWKIEYCRDAKFKTRVYPSWKLSKSRLDAQYVHRLYFSKTTNHTYIWIPSPVKNVFTLLIQNISNIYLTNKTHWYSHGILT